MTRRERLRAAVSRAPVDRVPYVFWRHFPAVDRSPAGLAQATLRFHERYGGDALVLTPAAGWAVEAWGCVAGEQLAPDGHRPCAGCAVRHGEDWRRIRPLDPVAAPGYAELLETIIRLGFDRRLGDAPALIMLPSPLSVARRLSGARLATDLAERPEAVTAALEAITETLAGFADLALAEGIAGVFFSIEVATRDALGEDAYARFGEPWDQRVLAGVRDRAFPTIVHGHGDRLLFDRLARLPADVLSWHDRATAPSLAEGQAAVAGAVLGGLDPWGTLRDGTAALAVAEVEDALAQTGGLGLIVGPGCLLPPHTPDATVAAVVRALGGALEPLPGVAL